MKSTVETSFCSLAARTSLVKSTPHQIRQKQSKLIRAFDVPTCLHRDTVIALLRSFKPLETALVPGKGRPPSRLYKEPALPA